MQGGFTDGILDSLSGHVRRKRKLLEARPASCTL